MKIDIFNHKIRLHPTMILNIKESFKGQYTFQKPAWRDECQFLPFTNMYKKIAPWLEACFSVKASLQTYSNMLNPCCSERHSSFAFRPCVAKTHPWRELTARINGKRASCADAFCGDSMSGSVGGCSRAHHPLVSGTWGFMSLVGFCLAIPYPWRRAVGFLAALAHMHGRTH